MAATEPAADEYRQAVIEAEAREHEAGYTLGAFNEHEHTFITLNASNPAMLSLESNHLEFVQGKGVRKTQERDCLRCHDTGLNDGQFHPIQDKAKIE